MTEMPNPIQPKKKKDLKQAIHDPASAKSEGWNVQRYVWPGDEDGQATVKPGPSRRRPMRFADE